MENKYWKGLEELNNDPQFLQYQKNEFAEGLPLEEVLNEENMGLTSHRRDFLKFFGFSISAVALAACTKAPVKNAIPYVVKPEDITPGVANWYASTNEYGTSILVKTREGRPIKIEGNPNSSIFKGGASAVDHAGLLSMYDSERFPYPMKDGKKSDWTTIDSEVTAALGQAKNIRIVTSSLNSPSTKAVIADFTSKYPGSKHVQHDGLSYSGMLLANERSFGKRVIPGYQFDKANIIVSFGADFLATWISPVEFTKQYVVNRKLDEANPKMSRHYQFESLMSTTGSNADYRAPLKNSEEGVAIVSLYNYLAQKAGSAQLPLAQNIEVAGNLIKRAADDLWANKGASLVVSQSNDADIQTVVNGINVMLNNYGSTIDLNNYSLQASAVDSDFEAFVEELEKGQVDAVILYNTNPAYTYYNKKRFTDALKKAKLTVSTAIAPDETAVLAKYIAPDNHYLESWNDFEVKAGKYSFSQPTISPVFNTRQMQESLLIWSGLKGDYYSYIRSNWEKKGMGTSSWEQIIHDGVYETTGQPSVPAAFSANLSEAVSGISKNKAKKEAMELILYPSLAIRDGKDANNAWLQEFPDPVSKVTWDNYASVAKYDADQLKLEENDLVNITVGSVKLEKVPVIIQPGQARGTIGIALGYGRKVSGKVGQDVGFDVFPFVKYNNGSVVYSNANVSIEKASGSYMLARTQTHHSIEGRDIVREAPIAEYVQNRAVRNEKHAHIISLWDDKLHETVNHHKWGMVIDLNACTGCGACIVSCSAENNVPVVGRDEVRIRREMHWMRIDRYYKFNPGMSTGKEHDHNTNGYSKEKDIEMLDADAFDDVSTVHQPMLCQHCGHAPCETVCPVLATTHSAEGLNQMTYNRCIGTRYCANNCPYKVRRYNWFRYNDNENFDYHLNNDLGKMVINPDVTVRTRGVMEKCTFCVQRIQEGKLTAKREGRKLRDGDIKTACQQSCPANAIVFGDMNDPESEISKLRKNKRCYTALEEINVQSSISYMTKIRNTTEKLS